MTTKKKFKVGDKVVKNPKRWLPSDFDRWGAGEGIGKIIADFGGGLVDVQWPNGRACQQEIELLPYKENQT